MCISAKRKTVCSQDHRFLIILLFSPLRQNQLRLLWPIHTSRGHVTCMFCSISYGVDCHWTLGADGWYVYSDNSFNSINCTANSCLPSPSPQKGLPGKSKSTIQGQYGRVVRVPDPRGPKRVFEMTVIIIRDLKPCHTYMYTL